MLPVMWEASRSKADVVMQQPPSGVVARGRRVLGKTRPRSRVGTDVPERTNRMQGIGNRE